MTIDTYEVKFIRDSDCWGPVYEIKCPRCKEIMRVTNSDFNYEICECGLKWNLIIRAEGNQ